MQGGRTIPEPLDFHCSNCEYDEVGFPFLANLGRAVYRYERQRERQLRLDLSRFRVHD